MQSERSSVRLPPKRAGWVFIAGAALVMAATTAASGFAIWRGRVDALAEWRAFLSNLSNVAAQHADQTVAAADAVLNRVVAQVRDGAPADATQLRRLVATESMHRFIAERQRELPQIEVVSLVADNGDVLNLSRTYPPPAINLADRDYFIAHRDDPALELMLSAPVRNRGNGQWTFFLARKLRNPQGRMIGLALVGIRSDYFERFYRSVDPGRGDITMALLRRDGVLLARHPHVEEAMGRPLRESASYRLLTQSNETAPTAVTDEPRATAPQDRRMRVVAPRVSQAYPMYVTSLADEDLVLRHWRRTAWLIGALALCLDLLMVGMAFWIFVQVRRRQRAMEQLDAARAAAEEADRAKTAFLANMSHEIRTPMNGLLGMTELLLRSPLGEREQRYADAAHRCGQALMKLLTDILAVADAESGGQPQPPQPFELRRLLADQLDMVRAAAQEKGLDVRLVVAPELPARLSGDVLALRQVLLHLLANAVKFTDHGRIEVHASQLSVEGTRHRVSLTVRDTGPGMAAEVVAALFQPFHLGDDSRSRRHGGSGLGLALTHKLVQRLGGTIVADSTPGEGSAFTVQLWLAEAA